MSASRIRTLEEYHTAYQQAADHPDAYWGNVAEEFTWR